MSSKVPPLLEPYLTLPAEAALILITSVLGASSNWLVFRFLHSYLRGLPPGSGEAGDVGVVLVSFMRDGSFWRDGAGRMGLDLDAMGRNGKFAFVDGLTGLFTGQDGGRKDRVLKSPRVEDVKGDIEAAVGDLRTQKKVLIVDQLDVLLAASGEDVSSTALANSLILPLRELAHSTVLTMAADDPLLHAQTTTLEMEHAALVLGQAHAADTLLALRMLDTGTAKDVSGVVRVTGARDGDGREFLYHVAGDGNVRVFERGT